MALSKHYPSNTSLTRLDPPGSVFASPRHDAAPVASRWSNKLGGSTPFGLSCFFGQRLRERNNAATSEKIGSANVTCFGGSKMFVFPRHALGSLAYLSNSVKAES
jgi:hypothetical protein